MKRIFLIGYMGAGKTTIGKIIAEKLGLTFIDLDSLIEKRFHKTINAIFAEKGEAAFREMERDALHEVGEYEDVVISLGGGAPCFFDNIDYINRQGFSIYLKVVNEVLAARLNQAKASRPLLRDKSEGEIATFIAEALTLRAPFYEKAKLIFDASDFNHRTGVDEMVPRLLTAIENA